MKMWKQTKAKLREVAAVAEGGRTQASKMRRRAATAAVCALTAMMAYTVVFGQNGLTAFEHKRQNARELKAQYDALQKENDRLRIHVEHLQTDAGAVEHEAREELHYTRDGEVIYTLGPDGTPGPDDTAASTPGRPPTAAGVAAAAAKKP